jgi:hypothetical protein
MSAKAILISEYQSLNGDFFDTNARRFAPERARLGISARPFSARPDDRSIMRRFTGEVSGAPGGSRRREDGPTQDAAIVSNGKGHAS